MRIIDADAVVQYLHEFRCADCDRRKGLKNGEIQFCYEIGDAPCRACDIGDTIEYFLDEDIAPTIYAIPIEWLREKIKEHTDEEGWQDYLANSFGLCIEEWQKEQEAR